MEKLEVIYALQKTIEQLYQESDSFEINMKEILALITAKRLIPDGVLQRVWEQLGTIRELGRICREGYSQLEMAGEIPEYIEQMRMALTVTERLLKEREVYFLAKEEFLKLYSERIEIEEPLVSCQRELAGYSIETMSEEEVKIHLEKYVMFMKAWREREAFKLIDYVQRLLEVFAKELVAAAVFQKDELKLRDIREGKKESFENRKCEEKEGNEFETDSIKSKQMDAESIIKLEKTAELEEAAKLQETVEAEKLEETAEPKKIAGLGKAEAQSPLLKKYQVEIESCIKKEKKKFGVKTFRSDMSGLMEGLRKRILKAARQYGGVTAELISAMTTKIPKEAKQECDVLFHHGYLRKYKIEGMEELYSISPKGKKAFEAWESLNYLNVKGGLSEWQSLEDTEDIGSAVAVRLMLLKVLEKEFQERIFPDIQAKHRIEQNVFFLRCRNLEDREWRYYTGASNWGGDEESYIGWLKAFIEESEEMEELEEIEALEELDEEETGELEGIEKTEESESLEYLEEDKKLAVKWVVIGDAVYGEKLKELIIKTYGEEIEPQSILLKRYEDECFFENEEEQDKLIEETVTAEETVNLEKTAVAEKTVDAKEAAVKEERMNLKEAVAEKTVDAKEAAVKKERGNLEKTVTEETMDAKEAAVTKEMGNLEETEVSKKIVNSEKKTDFVRGTVLKISNVKTGEEWEKDIIKNYQEMIEKDKIYCATAYLYAAAQQDKDLMRLYYKLAYAVNDPLLDCSYSSNLIFDIYFDEDDSALSEACLISALLRNYFMDHTGYDYQMQQLYDGVKERQMIVQDRYLGEVIYGLLEFKEQAHSGIDRFADYKRKDMVAWEAKIAEIKSEAKGYYENYVLGKMAEQASHRRFVETKKLIFAQESEFAFYLKVVSEDARAYLAATKQYLQANFIKDETPIHVVNLESDKINRFLNEKWDEAGQHLRIARKSSDLMSSLRMNLFNQVKKALSSMCDWVDLLENKMVDEKEKGFDLYKKVRDTLIKTIQKVMQRLLMEKKSSNLAGRKVLLFTLSELKARLVGTYQPNQEKYFYIRFLANDKVLLNHKYQPDAEMEVAALPEFALTKRIELHAKEEEQEFHTQMQHILDGEDDYGSAMLLERYFTDCEEEEQEYPKQQKYYERQEQQKYYERQEYQEYQAYQGNYNITEAILYAEKSARMKWEEFVENLELAESYGQMGNFSENKKENILRAVNECYTYACRTKNFGYFSKVLLAFQKKIEEEAKGRESAIWNEMETYLNSHKEILEEEGGAEQVEKIRTMIQAQNYTVAEDLLNRLINHEEESELELLKTDYLKDFLRSYDYNYTNVSDTGKKLHTLLMTSRAQKEIKGGRKLLESWLSNGGNLGEQKLSTLLTMLGFPVERVKSMQKIFNKIENYLITLKRPENGRKRNDRHPIAAFGSTAIEEGFRVVCLYGKYDASDLIDTFKEIGNAKHTIVLLDYPLSDSERRKLARKTKLEISEKIFGVIDRVLLVYLMNNYTETAINRMLMAVMMPYTYYQPYIVESANPMVPEIFIGRKEELSKIESPTGVNLVYGGRQIGKSALLRMARNAVDRNENGDRAVLVNIKDLDYTKTAWKVSQTLADEGILEQDFETNDWDKLARELKRRLQSTTEPKIPYLLLLLDEADRFIESCEAVNYHPFDCLKEIQEMGTERFKFVAAGLHNMIRFKRNSALGNNSVLTHMQSLSVKPFHVMEAKELLLVPLFYLGFRFPKEKDSLVSMILAATNYFPGLLQLYCAKLLEAMKRDYAGYNEKSTPPYEVQENHIKKVLSEEGFQQKIREKFMVTLKLDEDHAYYMIALLTAYMDYKERKPNGYSPKDILRYAKGFEIKKMKEMQPEQIEALMEEMRELNVLRRTSKSCYWFTRNNFFQMLGTVEQIEEELMKYMLE